MKVAIVWSLKQCQHSETGVVYPPREHEISDELLARELAERKRIEEAREAERMLA